MSLRPTFMGFETMSKALTASQKALDITGNNISNVTTIGYSRQRLDLYSINTPSGGLRYDTATALAGQGVGSSGVTQLRDQFLDKRYRELNADSGMAGTVQKVLKDIENVIDCIDTDGFNATYTNFKKALSGFTVDSPNRKELANITLTAAQQMATELRSYNTKLNQIQDQIKFEYDAGVERVSSILKEITTLNDQIANGYISSGDILMEGSTGNFKVNSTYGPNELKDKRNVLLDELSNYGNIRVQDEKDGTITVSFANTVVVEGTKCQTLKTEEHSTGALRLYFETTGGIRTDLSLDQSGLSSGGLRGYLDMYNGAGIYGKDVSTRKSGIEEQLNGANQILDKIKNVVENAPANMADLLTRYQGELSQFGSFAVDPATGETTLNGVNVVEIDAVTGDVTVNKLNVKAAADNTLLNVFAGTTPITFVAGDDKSIAKAVNQSADNYFDSDSQGIIYYRKMIDALANTIARAFNKANSDTETIDPATGKYITRPMFEPSGDNDEITAANIRISDIWLKDPMMIAYKPNGAGSVVPDMTELDPKYLNNIKKVLTEGLNFTIDTDGVNVEDKIIDQSDSTIEQYIQYWSNNLGQNIEYTNSVYKAADSMADNVASQRDGVMGVSLEEEGVNMMNFQKWFNAAARMMTTLDEALNTIISSMGLVGR